jgi:hypothetical protein
MSNEQQMYGTSGNASGDDSPSAIGDSEHHVYWSRSVRATVLSTLFQRFSNGFFNALGAAFDWLTAHLCLQHADQIDCSAILCEHTAHRATLRFELMPIMRS